MPAKPKKTSKEPGELLNEPVAYRKQYYNPLLSRSYWKNKTLKQIQKFVDDNYGGKQPLHTPTKTKPANLVSSLCTDGRHRPALDIDVPCELIPSSTEGHHHLYFPTVALSWKQYQKLLKVLGECGIVEEGYVKASIDRGQSFLRAPGVKKFYAKELLDDDF